ncbi:MAG: hypothetical protein M3Z54_08380 [Gemmatimonadota bacterium]|nr:hypothetical protein [Gemmatimonadota bacterium]
MRISVLLGAVCALNACGSASDTAAPITVDPVVGNYALQTVGGKILPALVSQNASGSRSIVSGNLSMEASRNYVITFDDKTVDGNGVASTRTNTAAGTWVKSGSGVVSFSDATVNGGPSVVVTGVATANNFNLSGSLFNEVGGDFFFSRTN